MTGQSEVVKEPYDVNKENLRKAKNIDDILNSLFIKISGTVIFGTAQTTMIHNIMQNIKRLLMDLNRFYIIS